ncbi:hypothetical protein PCANC_11033 [Puccinia coronata f. sp. avenae]|uniref:Uncharacterized protein n=1 Tax=Puccinia coronata f. sp. avenae TaxID=200324 RepID=A0A2N5UW51_9BASI|nr:hypothetical protein PCANC_11033 [Puccinia coronata f. sp. avenae]
MTAGPSGPYHVSGDPEHENSSSKQRRGRRPVGGSLQGWWAGQKFSSLLVVSLSVFYFPRGLSCTFVAGVDTARICQLERVLPHAALLRLSLLQVSWTSAPSPLCPSGNNANHPTAWGGCSVPW